MRFRSPPRLLSRQNLFRFLEADFWSWCAELFFGLNRLTFSENFESFQVSDLVIPSGSEAIINNQFGARRGTPYIPTSRLIIKQIGNGLLVDGDQEWTTQLLYMKNLGPDQITVSIIFFK